MTKRFQKILLPSQHKSKFMLANNRNLEMANEGSPNKLRYELSNPPIPSLQRQIWATKVGARYGNNHLLNILSVHSGASRQTNEIFRQIQYLNQISGEDAEPYLQALDESLNRLEKDSQDRQQSEDIRSAVSNLRSLRVKGKITIWHISGGRVYASYDNHTGEVRLHNNWGVGHATNTHTLLHEAIHALHGAQYPKIRKQYQTKTGIEYRRGILLLKWKAWTEYWAYRRVAEFEKIRSNNLQSELDPHEVAMEQQDVKRSIARVKTETQEDFDPSSWQPPARYKSRPGRSQPTQKKNKGSTLSRKGNEKTVGQSEVERCCFVWQYD